MCLYKWEGGRVLTGCVLAPRESVQVAPVHDPATTPSSIDPVESGPLRAVHLSRHKLPGGLVN